MKIKFKKKLEENEWVIYNTLAKPYEYLVIDINDLDNDNGLPRDKPYKWIFNIDKATKFTFRFAHIVKDKNWTHQAVKVCKYENKNNL